MATRKKLFIGLMSGTSMDAVDAVLVEFKPKITLLATHSEPLPSDLRQEIIALCQPGDNAIYRMGSVDVKLGHLFADATLNLIKNTNYQANEICAIGSHGQNIRHAPNSNFPFTLQIGDPNIIVAKTNITTVADFRRRDLALGGQAAPLAPGFHHYLFRSDQENRWVLNIGGIANLTLLAKDQKQPVIGFDTGPGNTLMDAFCWQQQNKYFDENGNWAANGEVNQELLNICLTDPYFSTPPPKSTGREYFNLNWLENCLAKLSATVAPIDVQATLLELTTQSIAQAVAQYPINNGSILVCGGGAKNKKLMQRLAEILTTFNVTTTESFGIHPDWIEACAFAWLAQQTLAGKPGNLPSVTGAKASAVLGGIYSK